MPAVLSRPALRPALAVTAATTLLMGAALTPAAHVAARVPHPASGAIMCPLARTHPLTPATRPPTTLPPRTCPGPNV